MLADVFISVLPKMFWNNTSESGHTRLKSTSRLSEREGISESGRDVAVDEESVDVLVMIVG